MVSEKTLNDILAQAKKWVESGSLDPKNPAEVGEFVGYLADQVLASYNLNMHLAGDGTVDADTVSKLLERQNVHAALLVYALREAVGKKGPNPKMNTVYDSLKKVVDEAVGQVRSYSQKGELSVIIADDEDALVKAYQRVVEKVYPGTKVDHVKQGDELVRKVDECKYDLVLTDNSMPGMTGLAATRKIREKNKDVPICMISGDLLEEEAKKAGVSYFLKKPFDTSELEAVLKQYLGGRK